MRKEQTFHRSMQDLMDQPERWAVIELDTLKQLVFYQCLLFHGGDERSMSPKLSNLYSALTQRSGAGDRLQLLDYVTRSLATNVGAVDSLLPFIYGDPEETVVSAASFVLALFLPLHDGDPMTGPRTLRSMADDAHGETARVGILKGLLLLGDRRTLPLLDGCWEKLGRMSRQRLAGCWGGAAYASLVDFLVGWMERAENIEDVHTVGEALAEIPIRSGEESVIEVERSFPIREFDDLASIRIVGEWTFREYGERIGHRLAAMRRHGAIPVVVPKVLRSWNIPSG